MKYRIANPDDLPKWLEVARDAGDIMRAPDMDTNAAFLEYARRKLMQDNAVMAYDGLTGDCAGFAGFSLSNNSVTWLGVKEKYRNMGIGSGLLAFVLNLLDKSRRITVNTYPESYIPGQAARRLYFKHGFSETTGEIFLFDGLEMVEFSIDP